MSFLHRPAISFGSATCDGNTRDCCFIEDEIPSLSPHCNILAEREGIFADPAAQFLMKRSRGTVTEAVTENEVPRFNPEPLGERRLRL
jgi:hypothetical protein